MKTPMVAYVVLFLALITVCEARAQVEPKNQAQSQVDALVAKLAEDDIEMIEILQIPPEVCTSISTTPESLEKDFVYKLVVLDIRNTVYRDQLLRAMKSVVVQPERDIGDMRWGVVFYDGKDSRVGAIYMDKWGKRGAVGNMPVSFKGNLFKWLDRNFSCCFR
jgi:hypothetical protein